MRSSCCQSSGSLSCGGLTIMLVLSWMMLAWTFMDGNPGSSIALSLFEGAFRIGMIFHGSLISAWILSSFEELSLFVYKEESTGRDMTPGRKFCHRLVRGFAVFVLTFIVMIVAGGSYFMWYGLAVVGWKRQLFDRFVVSAISTTEPSSAVPEVVQELPIIPQEIQLQKVLSGLQNDEAREKVLAPVELYKVDYSFRAPPTSVAVQEHVASIPPPVVHVHGSVVNSHEPSSYRGKLVRYKVDNQTYEKRFHFVSDGDQVIELVYLKNFPKSAVDTFTIVHRHKMHHLFRVVFVVLGVFMTVLPLSHLLVISDETTWDDVIFTTALLLVQLILGYVGAWMHYHYIIEWNILYGAKQVDDSSHQDVESTC